MESVMQRIVTEVLDAFESCVNVFVLPAGKRLVSVLLVLVGITVISTALELLGCWTIVSWQEGLTACGIVGVICIVNVVSQKGIKGLMERIGGAVHGK